MLITTNYPCEKMLYSLTQNWDKRLVQQWSLYCLNPVFNNMCVLTFRSAKLEHLEEEVKILYHNE